MRCQGLFYRTFFRSRSRNLSTFPGITPLKLLSGLLTTNGGFGNGFDVSSSASSFSGLGGLISSSMSILSTSRISTASNVPMSLVISDMKIGRISPSRANESFDTPLPSLHIIGTSPHLSDLRPFPSRLITSVKGQAKTVRLASSSRHLSVCKINHGRLSGTPTPFCSAGVIITSIPRFGVPGRIKDCSPF